MKREAGGLGEFLLCPPSIFLHIRDRRENILNNGAQQKPLITLLRAMHLNAEQFNEIKKDLATVVLKRLLAINSVRK